MRTERPFDATIQKICRALCEVNKVPENTYIEGLPRWKSFRGDALIILARLNDGDVLPNGLVVGQNYDRAKPLQAGDGEEQRR
jgi:hypothetical protein